MENIRCSLWRLHAHIKETERTSEEPQALSSNTFTSFSTRVDKLSTPVGLCGFFSFTGVKQTLTEFLVAPFAELDS